MEDNNVNHVGRPLKLTESDKEKIVRLAKYGFTDDQISDVFGITKQTLNNYKKYDPIFFDSLKASKEFADLDVIESLYKRATGYDCTEEKQFFDAKNNDVITHSAVRHYPPDPTSMIYWLKNRKPAMFKDKVDDGKEEEAEKIGLAYK